MPNIHFIIECSKGTYIRAIVDDFGKALKSRAVLSSLRRLRIGEFDVNDAFDLKEFSELFQTEKIN